MSWPQQIGDLVLPSDFGHLDIKTTDLVSSVIDPFSNGVLQSELIVPRPMLQTPHETIDCSKQIVDHLT